MPSAPFPSGRYGIAAILKGLLYDNGSMNRTKNNRIPDTLLNKIPGTLLNRIPGTLLSVRIPGITIFYCYTNYTDSVQDQKSTSRS